MTSGTRRRSARGFTLTELAVVIAIVSLLLGGLLMTLSAQNQARQSAETQRLLETARDALTGFAIKFGRLPCPAAPGATGVESFVNLSPSPGADRACTNKYDGFLPARDLGIGPTDPQGYLLDAWGNRVRYAVSGWIPAGSYDSTKCPPNAAPNDFTRCPLFTTTNGLLNHGLQNIPAPLPELRVCDSGTCMGLDQRTPAIVFSTGPTGVNGPLGLDEQENLDADFVFVARPPANAGGADFDDVVIWLSPNILYNRLISAGAV